MHAFAPETADASFAALAVRGVTRAGSGPAARSPGGPRTGPLTDPPAADPAGLGTLLAAGLDLVGAAPCTAT
ncbi:hypothetical protein GCM10027072_57090 [Streptomyces bullii]